MSADDNETARQEAGWPVELTTAYRMGQAYAFDRIEKLDRGEPVDVYLWEVIDVVPTNQREGIYEGARFVLDCDGRLCSDLGESTDSF
jgi:hypothetical protein